MKNKTQITDQLITELSEKAEEFQDLLEQLDMEIHGDGGDRAKDIGQMVLPLFGNV